MMYHKVRTLCIALVLYTTASIGSWFGRLPPSSQKDATKTIPYNIRTATYTLENGCNLSDKPDSECPRSQFSMKSSLIRCFLGCKLGCYAVSIGQNGSCHHHHTNINCKGREQEDGCAKGDNSSYFYWKDNPCKHDSHWDVDTDTCVCVRRWVGRRCERHPSGCKELIHYGYKNFRGMVTLKLPTFPKPFRVRCVIILGEAARTIVMSTTTGLPNKTWEEYRHGFFSKLTFWAGLEQIKALNEAGLDKLVVHFSYYDVEAGRTKGYQQYEDFRLTGADSNYIFSGTETGMSENTDIIMCGSLLTSGVGFSTWDNSVEDVHGHNCAAQEGMGWWFKSCYVVRMCKPTMLEFAEEMA